MCEIRKWNKRPSFGMWCWNLFSPCQYEYSCCAVGLGNLCCIVPSLLVNLALFPACLCCYYCQDEEASFAEYSCMWRISGVWIVPEDYHIEQWNTYPANTDYPDISDNNGFHIGFGKPYHCCGTRWLCWTREGCGGGNTDNLGSCCSVADGTNCYACCGYADLAAFTPVHVPPQRPSGQGAAAAAGEVVYLVVGRYRIEAHEVNKKGQVWQSPDIKLVVDSPQQFHGTCVYNGKVPAAFVGAWSNGAYAWKLNYQGDIYTYVGVATGTSIKGAWQAEKSPNANRSGTFTWTLIPE